jgi:hypothetical protein
MRGTQMRNRIERWFGDFEKFRLRLFDQCVEFVWGHDHHLPKKQIVHLLQSGCFVRNYILVREREGRVASKITRSVDPDVLLIQAVGGQPKRRSSSASRVLASARESRLLQIKDSGCFHNCPWNGMSLQELPLVVSNFDRYFAMGLTRLLLPQFLASDLGLVTWAILCVETVPQHVANLFCWLDAVKLALFLHLVKACCWLLCCCVLLRVVDCCVVARSFMFYENCAMRISSDT